MVFILCQGCKLSFIIIIEVRTANKNINTVSVIEIPGGNVKKTLLSLFYK